MSVITIPIRWIAHREDLKASVFNRPYQDFVENMEAFEATLVEMLNNLSVTSIVSGTFPSYRFPYASTLSIGLVRKATDTEASSAVRRETQETGDPYVSADQAATTLEHITGRRGISLMGNPLVVAGGTRQFIITDYNSFMSYEVSFDKGTASIDEHLIDITVDAGATGVGKLTVSADGSIKTFPIAIGVASVEPPSILYPVHTSVLIPENPTIAISQFRAVPVDSDEHVSTDWQISTNPGFTNIVKQSMGNTTNLTSWPVTGLVPGNTYYVRARFNGNAYTSSWSNTSQFTVMKVPNTPSITSPYDGESGISGQPFISSSAFSSPTAEDHDSTDWEIRKASDNSLVWSSYGNGLNLLSIQVPSDILEVSTQYKVRVRHIGSVLGRSNWSPFVTFTTDSEFFRFVPDSAGLPYGGGYYAGANIVIGGQRYALIVAPRVQGGMTQLPITTKAFMTPEANYEYDGKTNTEKMLEDDPDGYPAAKWASELTINGKTDWYIPSLYEMEIAYRYLKPTTTDNSTGVGINPYADPETTENYTPTDPSITLASVFQQGGAESFVDVGQDDRFWTSTIENAEEARRVRFIFGSHIASDAGNEFYVRAFRRELIE